MIVSTRGRYALRVLIDLAENGNGSYIAMKTIAERQGLSLKYLERILPVLTQNKIVEGIQGKGGGYRLCRPPEEYHLDEILRLVEGDLAPVACMECGAEPCIRAAECRTRPVWQGLQKVIDGYLHGITLDSLLKKDAAPCEAEK